LDSDPEPFDLVLSDWQRPELHLDTLSAGIHLLRQLRKQKLSIPVVFYHGTADVQERAARRDQALREGAFGEAVMPDELLGLVTKALAMG
jgi:CheY-like chemotaxis protein